MPEILGALFKIKSKHGESRGSKQEPEPGVLEKLAKAPLSRPGTKRENRGQGGAHANMTEARGDDRGTDRPRSFLG
jgi:hypothetical protein